MHKICDDIPALLKEIHHNNDGVSLKVKQNNKGDLYWIKGKGFVKIKLPNNRTYTVSNETYDKIEPYLV